MIKESTRTIYNCLEPSFWTQRKCSQCQKFFSLTDLTSQNYQLFFKQVIKSSANSLEVIVQLTHLRCPLDCVFSYRKDIIC